MGQRVSYPAYDADLFAQEALRAPFAHYKAIRDAGPVVRLSALDMLAVGRFEDVQAALRSPETLISGEGIGFNPVVNTQTAERGVLTSDGDRHRRLRTVLNKPLSPASLKEHRAMLKSLMEAKVDTYLGADT